MGAVEIIVEYNPVLTKHQEEMILRYGKLKYRLPMINCMVMEIDEDHVRLLDRADGIEGLYENAAITAQIDAARKKVAADNISLTGKGVVIAFLDTGVDPVPDFCEGGNRIKAFKDFVNDRDEPYDDNRHGTHVTGIAAGNGFSSNGRYMGIAPEAEIVGVKILDERGKGSTASVLAGIQWLLDNRDKYGVRIMNFSLGTGDRGSADPLIRAVEAVWDAGIVVIAAAGNGGPDNGSVTSPGVSRKIITVGASDDCSSVKIFGGTFQNFSGRGPTSECICKPDIIAPGSNVLSCMAITPAVTSEDVVDGCYVRMSGTSMSTPVVSGAIALLLQKHPYLKPDDIKLMLKKSARDISYPKNHQGWGLLDIKRLTDMEALYVKKI